jgi:GNAT superfamily N-acetyltransferase
MLNSEAGIPAPLPVGPKLAPKTAVSYPYEYRRLDMAELPLLNDLYNACYRSERPLAEAAWLYAQNPNGPAVIYAAFDERGRLAGMRPAIPFRLSWRGRERMAYEFADALVDPAHRNRGIFSRLVKLTCGWAEQEGHTLYSIPNENSLPVYRRSPGLTVVEGSETRAKPLSWPRYLAHRLGWPGAGPIPAPGGSAALAVICDGDVRLRPIERFESDFEDVHAEIQERVASFTLRRRDFLQWRYFGSPVRQYRAALVEERGQARGYVAMRMISRVAHLVDVFVRPDARLARRALRLAGEWAKAMGAVGIHFNASEGNVFHAAAARSGYWLKKRSGSIVIDRESARLLAPDRALATRDLYFVMGDFDFM